MDWTYQGKEIDETVLDDYIGFVYQITNITNNRKYIGKKLLKFSRTKQVKGKKKRIKVDSDWKTYYGSSEELQNDVKLLGEDKFTREILGFYKTKGECSYMEAFYQFKFDVLKFPEYWYNSWISVKVHRSHLSK